MTKPNEHGEHVTKRQASALRNRLGRQAKGCALYGTQACPFATCVVAIQTDRIASNTCTVFTRGVLPEDPQLERDYHSALPADHPLKPAQATAAAYRSCKRCGVAYQPTGRRQARCSDCAALTKKENDAKRKKANRLTDVLKTAHL